MEQVTLDTIYEWRESKFISLRLWDWFFYHYAATIHHRHLRPPFTNRRDGDVFARGNHKKFDYNGFQTTEPQKRMFEWIVDSKVYETLLTEKQQVIQHMELTMGGIAQQRG